MVQPIADINDTIVILLLVTEKTSKFISKKINFVVHIFLTEKSCILLGDFILIPELFSDSLILGYKLSSIVIIHN